MVAQKHLKESMLEKIQESKSKKSLENSQVSSAKSKSK